MAAIVLGQATILVSPKSNENTIPTASSSSTTESARNNGARTASRGYEFEAGERPTPFHTPRCCMNQSRAVPLACSNSFTYASK